MACQWVPKGSYSSVPLGAIECVKREPMYQNVLRVIGSARLCRNCDYCALSRGSPGHWITHSCTSGLDSLGRVRFTTQVMGKGEK